MFFEEMFKVAAFDFYDTGDMINDTLKLLPTEPLNINFEELGFESRYLLNNMGTMIFMFIIYPMLMIIQKIAQKCKNICNCCRKTHHVLKSVLYYEILITMVFESYLMIIMSCFIAIPFVSFNSYGESIQSLACICFLAIDLILPYIAICYAAKNFELLNTRRIRARFGALYQDLRLSNGIRVLYQPTFFLIRRIILALTVVVIKEMLILQLLLVFFQSFVAILILQLANPYRIESQLRMEMLNECVLLTVAYTIICFSSWIPNIETKYKIGYVSSCIVCIHLIVNLSIITYTTIKTNIRRCQLKKATKDHN